MTYPSIRSILIVLVIACAGCSDSPVVPDESEDSSLQIAGVRIDSQPTGIVAGSNFERAPTVRLVGPSGVELTTVSGIKVKATLTEPGARLTGDTVQTVTDGIARFEGLGVSDGLGGNRVRFSTDTAGGVTSSWFPVRSVTWTQVSTKASHVCAVTESGQAYCWGFASLGRIGTDSALKDCANGKCAPEPRPVETNFTFKSVVPGSWFSCGVLTSQEIACYGYGSEGELGSSTTQSVEPVKVDSNQDFRQVAAGVGHACGLATNGDIYCWGDNARGALGTGSWDPSSTPTKVDTAVTFEKIATGGDHTCAVSSSGAAYCWGLNASGQVGNSSVGDSVNVPVLVESGVDFKDIAAGLRHSCALSEAGTVYCWGDNVSGQLGVGEEVETRTTPEPVAGGRSYLGVDSGEFTTCAVEETTHLIDCWGGAQPDTPSRVDEDIRFRTVAAGKDAQCGLTIFQSIYCWSGSNISGSVGNGTFDPTSKPVWITDPNHTSR